jgi:hypothetical protein
MPASYHGRERGEEIIGLLPELKYDTRLEKRIRD